MGVDQINKNSLFSNTEIQKITKIKLRKKNYLITYHPETIKSKNNQNNNIFPLLNSLKKLKNSSLVFTIPNTDSHNKKIYKDIKNFVKKNKNCYLFKSLGHKLYLSLIKNVNCVIGNSSSGLHEVPFFKKPTINIGDRQKGRIKVESVIDVNMNSNEITKALNKINFRSFKKKLKKVSSPYGKGGAGKKIIKKLKKINLANIKNKKFIDLRFN